MTKTRFHLDTVSEFAGAVPEVSLAAGVDLALLTQGDDDPMFVTLPVAEVDAVSGNNRYYDAAFVKELERQILEERPPALMGHLPDEDRATAHPLPAGYWVGASRHDNKLWGKAYIPPGAVREYMRRQKATNSKIGTSVYGTAESVWMPEKSAYRVTNFELESIDFGAPKRIGVRSLGAVPEVTSELEGDGLMDRTQVIREMTADDARILPDVVRSAVLETAPERGVLAELAGILDTEGDVVDAVRELVNNYRVLNRTLVNQAIDAAVTEQVKVESVRGIVVELVRAKSPASVDAVGDVVAEVVGGDVVKTLLETALVSEMGPAQRRPGNQPDNNNGGGMLKPKPGRGE